MNFFGWVLVATAAVVCTREGHHVAGFVFGAYAFFDAVATAFKWMGYGSKS